MDLFYLFPFFISFLINFNYFNNETLYLYVAEKLTELSNTKYWH